MRQVNRTNSHSQLRRNVPTNKIVSMFFTSCASPSSFFIFTIYAADPASTVLHPLQTSYHPGTKRTFFASPAYVPAKKWRVCSEEPGRMEYSCRVKCQYGGQLVQWNLTQTYRPPSDSSSSSNEVKKRCKVSRAKKGFPVTYVTMEYVGRLAHIAICPSLTTSLSGDCGLCCQSQLARQMSHLFVFKRASLMLKYRPLVTCQLCQGTLSSSQVSLLSRAQLHSHQNTLHRYHL